ncbi:MAG TPA: hypothetical protein VFH51_05825 [Myxococcota bacterium]|nr:hypothetical protein [Myxococcota bacterium]
MRIISSLSFAPPYFNSQPRIGADRQGAVTAEARPSPPSASPSVERSKKMLLDAGATPMPGGHFETGSYTLRVLETGGIKIYARKRFEGVRGVAPKEGPRKGEVAIHVLNETRHCVYLSNGKLKCIVTDPASSPGTPGPGLTEWKRDLNRSGWRESAGLFISPSESVAIRFLENNQVELLNAIDFPRTKGWRAPLFAAGKDAGIWYFSIGHAGGLVSTLGLRESDAIWGDMAYEGARLESRSGRALGRFTARLPHPVGRGMNAAIVALAYLTRGHER